VSTTVEAVANRTGYTPSIAIGADGVPIIAHRDETVGVLKISRCTDVPCAAAETISNDAGPSSGAQPSMIIDALGLPAIAHIDTNDIRVTIATNQGWGP
jgi:hypothetical protein